MSSADSNRGDAALSTPFASYDHLPDLPRADSEESFVVVSPCKPTADFNSMAIVGDDKTTPSYVAANNKMAAARQAVVAGTTVAATAAAQQYEESQAIIVDSRRFADTTVIEELTSSRFLETVCHKIAKSNLNIQSYGSIASQSKIDSFLTLQATHANTHCPTIVFAEGSIIRGAKLQAIAETGQFPSKGGPVQVATSPTVEVLPLAIRPRYFVVVCVGLMGLEDPNILRGHNGNVTFQEEDMVLPLWLAECHPVKDMAGGGRKENDCTEEVSTTFTGDEDCTNNSTVVAKKSSVGVLPPPPRNYTIEDVQAISEVSSKAVLPAVYAGGVRRGGGGHKTK